MATAPLPTSRSARTFRALLRLYPAAFREEYGREMALVFADRHRDAAGPLDLVWLWLNVVAGILTEAPREHLRLTNEDLRDALRRLRASPGFAATSVATLALAIGASTAMFSVIDTLLLRPLPYAEPERLTMIWTEIPAQRLREGRSAFGNVEQWRIRNHSFEDLAAFDPISATLTQDGSREQISVARVSPNFFPLLGISPVRGRVFSEDDAQAHRRLALISHRFWRTRFGGAAGAIGASLEIDDVTSQIVGILPETLASAGFDADVWEPHTLFADWETRRTATGLGTWFVIGRLRPRVTIDQAQADMNALASHLDDPSIAVDQRRGIRLVPLSLHVTGPRPRLVMWILAGAALCLLLVATANVAGLSLARSAGRVPEMAIRAALGASRARIVRQLLAEGVVVAAAAGAAGLLLAAGGIRAIRVVGPASLVRLQEVGLDWRVFGWALAVSLSSGALVGLAPAMTTWRRDLRGAGADGGRGIAGGAATRIRRSLVIAECTVAMVLLVGAGLLVRSWWNVIRVDPGFNPDRLLSLSLATPGTLVDANRADFYTRVLAEAAVLPGVESAGISSELFVGAVSPRLITAESDETRGGVLLPFRSDEVSAGFFRTLGTSLLRGRDFSAADAPMAPPVAIVNDAMAAHLWPGGDPLGRRYRVGPAGQSGPWVTVIGVVADMRRQGLETEPVPQVFEPIAQNPPRRAILFARASMRDVLALAAPLRAAVARVDASALVYQVGTVDERLGAFIQQRRFQTWLLTAFALTALLLVTIGIYGLVQYSVAARTREIGIRLALGAQRADIFRMIVREGLLLSVTGLVPGLIGAWWLGRAGASLLFGVIPADPATFIGGSVVLIVATVAVCSLPARRAMHVPPIAALQSLTRSHGSSRDK